MSTNKYCFSRSCSNNSKRNPDKHFFRVPHNRILRDKWCKAVGRDPESIKQTSTANCCSDHFDLELDLDRYTSSIGNAKLEKDSIPSPSGMHENIIERNAEIMKTLDIFKGNDLTPENLYVREVVYIEENQNDRFLEEGLESEDIMLIEPDTEAKNEPTKDVSVMQPNRSPMSRPTSIQNQIVPYRSKEPNEFSALKPLKPSILRHRKQMISVEKLGSGKRKSVPMPIPVQIPEKNVLPKPNLRIGKPVTMKLQVMPNVVNKMKYSNYDEFKKFLSHKNLESTGSKSQDDDDDDCILVEEQNVLNNERTATNLNPSMKVLTSLPPSISIKYSKCAKPVQYSNGGTFSLAEASKPVPSQVPLNNANALVPVGPKLNRARTEEVTNNMPTVPDGGVFQLIKLMIAENQMLLANKKGNCVKIARTKPNQFRIFDNIYYYRTNNSFAKNYFFMNITRNAVHSEEIIQRNYGIYWGHPRRSCVGIVETKGILDDNTKDFVFQQVKKSLFNENGPQNLKLVNVSQPNQKHLRKYQLMRHRFVQHNIDQMNSTATSTKSITDRVPNIIRKFMKIPMESTPKTQISELQSKTKISELQSKTHISELQSKTHINTELMEETSDGSLLLPQFEVPIKESFKDDATGFTLVKCKQEPEAYFEIIEPPFSTDDKVPLKKPKQKTRKRKLSNKVGGFEEIEETDSAPECFNNETGGSKRRRKKLSGKRTNVKEFKDLVKEVKEVRKSQKKTVRELLKAKKWFQ